MSAILVISFFLVVAAALALRKRQSRSFLDEIPSRHSPFQFDGLFAEQHAIENRQLAQAEAKLREQERRERLLERAAQGDEKTLHEAHQLSDPRFYQQTLDTLIAHADEDTNLLQAIAEYIVDSRELRASTALVSTVIQSHPKTLDRRSLVDLLHLAALSDDVQMFARAIEFALQQWHAGRMPKVTAKDFLAAVESAYWLVATEVRYSGAGFFLKRLIAELRRELAVATRRSA